MTSFAKPTQAFSRAFYETGRTAATPNDGGNLISAANAYEPVSIILETPGFLASLEVAINDGAPAGNLYLLAFDVAPTQANLNLLAAGNGGAARYTFGPLVAGGTMAREWSEVFPPVGDGQQPPFITGAPFDNGCILAASTTPVTFTAPAGNAIYHAVARITRVGC